MSHLFEAFEIELPAAVTPALAAELAQDVAATSGVGDSGASASRAIDAASLTVWVTLAGGAIGALGGAVTVITQIAELFRRKGVQGARLVLADGTSIPVEHLSAQALLDLAGKSQGTSSPGG